MTPRLRKLFTFPIDDELMDGLRTIEERDDTTYAEQIRRGIRMWLQSRGVRTTTKTKAAPRRASTRRKA